MTQDASLREALAERFAPEQLEFEPDDLSRVGQNTLGLQRAIRGVVHPRSVEEVQALVRIAAEHGVPLYPVSRGFNLGYGEKVPATADNLVVSLAELKSIRELDRVSGSVWVEPGVTQGQLYAYLQEQGGEFWMDVTGSGLGSSLVGNTLDGGFGHTPVGNRRKNISDVEVVLGDGRLLHTGRFPGLGPDLAQLFVQSNFGIVTAVRVKLFRARPRCETFVLQLADGSRIGELIDAINDLTQLGVLESQVHTANAIRQLMALGVDQEAVSARGLIKGDDALELLRDAKVLAPVPWNALGALYGDRQRIAWAKRQIKRRVKGLCKLAVLSEFRIRWIPRIAGFLGRLGWKGAAPLIKGIQSLKTLQGLQQGIPTDDIYNNAAWRVDDPDSMGLIWFAPVIEAAGPRVHEALDLAESIFHEHGFEFPVTMTLVEPGRLICVMNLSFNRKVAEEVERAHKAYADLHDRLHAAGIHTYRTSVLNMAEHHFDPERQHALDGLKAALDPSGIIAPGRYGIGAPSSKE